MTAFEDSRNAVEEADRNGWTLCCIEFCQEHLLLYPRDSWAWVHLNQSLMKISRYQPALDALDRAWDAGDECLRPLLCLRHGNLLQRRGDYKAASLAYERAISLCSWESFAFNFAGLLERKRGDFRAAEELLRQGAACLDSASDESWALLSTVLWSLGRHEEALDACEKARALDPENRATQQHLEDIHAALEVLREPRREPWERQVLAEPDNVANEKTLRENSMRRIRQARDQERKFCTLELCREHTRLYPNDTRAWGEFARVLTSFAFYEDALAAVDQAQEQCSEAAKPVAWEIRGSLWEERGDFNEAARCYAESLALRPMALMYNVAGRLEWHRGDLRAAEKLLRQGTVCQCEPDEDLGLCWDSLISVLWALEWYDEALQACIKAIQIDPEYQPARNRFEDLHAALAARSVLRRDT